MEIKPYQTHKWPMAHKPIPPLQRCQVNLRPCDRLAETARASLGSGLVWRAVARPTTPDPLLMAHGSPCAMVRTPDPPESRKLSAVLESQPSDLTERETWKEGRHGEMGNGWEWFDVRFVCSIMFASPFFGG